MTVATLVGVRDVAAAARKAWGSGPRDERALLLRARPEWPREPALQVDALDVRVGVAVSPLAVRELLAGIDEDLLVILTDVAEHELGSDLLSRCYRQRVVSTDLWESVRTSFGVNRPEAVDGALVRDGEVLAKALLDRAPSGGWPTPTSGILTREHAYRSLAAEVLGTPRDLDAAGLLDWSTDAHGTLALRDLDPPLQHLLTSWVLRRAGEGTRLVVDLAAAGRGTDALPLGLVAGVAWSPAGTGRTQGRLEQVVGGDLTVVEARAWASLSEAWVGRRLSTDAAAAQQVLREADRLLVELGAGDIAGTSTLLPAGLAARCRDLAEELPAAVRVGDLRARVRVETALAAVQAHQLAADDDAAQALWMGVRLVRWLGTASPRPTHLREAVAWQVVEGGWVDRARQVLANGTPDPRLRPGLEAVHVAATARRAEVDRAAATHLAAAVETDQATGRMVPVEDALVDLVRPLAADAGPVLLLVLDGMSAAVATEVVESAVSLGWVEHQRDPEAGRDALLAGIPTVTEVSRTSLLAGRRQRGGQREERAGLEQVLGAGTPLFHLADLRSGVGRDLPDDVRDAVQDAGRPVVAAVLNAVDDSLSGGDPARTRWSVSSVRHLPELLERARAAGRVVVLTSDHGHVIDQGPDSDVLFERSGAGARWRTSSSAAEAARDGEVRLAGPRVLLGGGDVVAAVSETLRYKQRSEGYHGGAALAELAIPFVVLSRLGSTVPGHTPVRAVAPSWWVGPAETHLETGSDQETLFG